MTSCHVRPIPSHKHAGIFNCPLYWPRQLCPRHFADDQRLPFAERIRIGACSILFIISPTSYVPLDRSAFIRPFVQYSLQTDLNPYHPHPLAQYLQTQRYQLPLRPTI